MSRTSAVTEFLKEIRENSTPIELYQQLVEFLNDRDSNIHTRWGNFNKIRKALVERGFSIGDNFMQPKEWRKEKQRLESEAQLKRDMVYIDPKEIDVIITLPPGLHNDVLKMMIVTGRRLSDLQNEWMIEDGRLMYKPSKKKVDTWCVIEELAFDGVTYSQIIEFIERIHFHLETKSYGAFQKQVDRTLKSLGLKTITKIHQLRSIYAQILTEDLPPQQRPEAIRVLLCHDNILSSNRYNQFEIREEEPEEEVEEEPVLYEDREGGMRYCFVFKKLYKKSNWNRHINSKGYKKKLEKFLTK